MTPAQTHPIDVERLRRELEATLEGEVRFDKVSRALYSTDASVYHIEPLGVVVPRSRDDVIRTIHGFDAAVIWKGARASSALM